MKKLVLNKQLLEHMAQTSFDSATPNGLCAIVQHVKEPGNYTVTFMEDDRETEWVQLAVSTQDPGRKKKSSPDRVSIRPASGQQGRAQQAEHSPDPRFTAEAGPEFAVEAGGYVVINTPVGVRKSAVMRTGEGHEAAAVLDSQRLGADARFSVVMFRPGTYSLKNTITGAEGTITVAYPVVGKEPYRPPEPVTVKCSKGKFFPDTIALKPAQSIIFYFNEESRVKIDLLEPDDGPEESRRSGRSKRWRKTEV